MLLVATGTAIVAVHALGFRAFATNYGAAEFTVDVSGPLASSSRELTIIGTVPSAARSRVETTTEGAGPGLQRRRWFIDYRGGFSRSAYAAQLVGPYQDPAKPACSGRVVVSQNLLDDGKASEGSLAAEIKKQVTREMSGLSVWPAGSFTRVEHISVKWAHLELHPDDWAMIGKAPHGYVQVSLRIGFDRVSVPMVLALIPNDPSSAAGTATELTFKIVSRADFSFDNRVFQFLNDKLGGNKLATKLAREQIDGLLLTALAPPPPFALDAGQTLQFTYCDQPPEVADGQWGALPFAVVIGRVGAATESILPPQRGTAPHAMIAHDAQLALDLDLDALNAILYELWRGGFLDRKLAEAGLDRQFNADPTVAALLSIRMSPPRLALPPVLTLAHESRGAANGALPAVLRLSADARVTIVDGTADDAHRTTTVGRVWGGVSFSFDRQEAAANVSPLAANIVHLDELDLACENAATTRDHAVVKPCHGDLVATMRERAAEFDGPLTSAFSKLLSDVFIQRRIGANGLPADILITAARPSVTSSGENASLHLDLRASLAPAQ
ncbi:hypothetical protein BH11MYX2_BH11MYX2_02400 [soil metagenome]